MKRSPLPLAIVVVLVIGGLGWLARAWLREAPVVPARNGPAEVAATHPTTVPANPAVADPDGKQPSAPTPNRTEEQNPVKPPTAEPTGAPGSIVGRVLNPQDEPVAGAEVELKRGPSMGLQLPALTTATGLIVQTGADGRFRFATVDPNDDYLVFARHADFGDCEAGPINVVSGQEATVADIRLRVGIQVEGTVTSNGRPVSGATITLSNAMDKLRRFNPGPLKDRMKDLDLEQIDLKTLTDASGHYSYPSVSFDMFEITAEADGLARLSKNSQGNFLGASAREHKIDFELGPAVTITGKVIDENKNAIPGAKVHGTVASQTFRCESEAVSDAGGHFTLEHLAAGQYFLAAECEGFSSANKAQVEAGASDVELEMRIQGSVTGVVVDEQSGAPITEFELAVLQSFKGRGPATSKEHLQFNDSGGRFEIKNLDPGRYTILATVVDYADSTSDEFEVVRGQTSSGIRVAMNKGGSVEGVVVDRSGKPVKNALVQVRENKMKDNPVNSIFGGLVGGADRVKQARTGADGSFRIDLIVPDTYQIFVSRKNQFAPLSIDDVVIAKDALKQLGQIEISKGGKVSGHAYDLEGLPLAGATIVGVSKSGDYHSARSQNDGYYEISGLPEGEYTITINSYQSNPPINTLKQLVLAKNSAQKRQIVDGDDLNVDLRLSEKK